MVETEFFITQKKYKHVGKDGQTRKLFMAKKSVNMETKREFSERVREREPVNQSKQPQL